MKWNDIPFDENASGEVKGLEFDLQYEENRQSAERPPEPTGQTSYGESE